MSSRNDRARLQHRRLCARFELGQSRSGRWILRDAEGLGYAVFASADAAIRYALEETGGAPDAVIVRPGDSEIGFDSGRS